MAMPQPPAAMQTMTVFWHFARGMAMAAKGKVAEAEADSREEYGQRRRDQSGPEGEWVLVQVPILISPGHTVAAAGVWKKLAAGEKPIVR